MGTADLKAKFKSRRHEINVSTYQMCVLLLFNDQDTLSYAQISEATAIPVGDLKRALQSLACAKFKILRKDPVGREVEDGDTFSFNEDFSAKQLRFKVGTVSAQKENEAEKQETRQKARPRRSSNPVGTVRPPSTSPRPRLRRSTRTASRRLRRPLCAS